jgi:hypothetical protein|nr:S46 family peptidase [Kofleriaceae bacterium]
MIRYVVVAAALAACGSPEKPPQPVTRDTLGSTTHATRGTSEGSNAPQTTDSGLAARRAYSNPGGMWRPQQLALPQLADTLRSLGLQLDPKTLGDPLQEPLAAVVSLGGCTGSFVSPEGLIATNHHCAQGALLQISDNSHNYLEDGFLAKSHAEDKPAGPSQHVMVAQAFTDVSKRIRDELDAIGDPIARRKEIENREKELVAACEKDRPWLRCVVSSFFHGGQFELIEMLDIKDVRVVYVPARAVGDYGGEIDNWEWPRHTGDWSFFRAYVGRDGKPADYSPENIPYQPKHYLHVSAAGLKTGDFVMAAGYPGRTERTETASQLHHDLDWGYPTRIDYDTQRYKIAEEHWKDGGEIGRKAGVMKQGIENGLEKTQGIVQGFTKNPDLVKQKDELDRKAKAWAAQPGYDIDKTGIERYEALIADQFKAAPNDFARAAAFHGSTLLASAIAIAHWAEERAKKDDDRKPGYQQRDLERATAGQKALGKRYDKTLDRAFFRLALVRALALPEAERPWLATLLGTKKGAKLDEAAIDKVLDAWYAGTKLESDATRIELLDKSTMRDLESTKDPFVQAALRVWPVIKADEKTADARDGELALFAPMYVEAMRQALGGALAPDANGTLRVTFGTVKSLHPDAKDLASGAFTVASQILAKDTGKEPFNSPKKVLDAIKAKNFGPYGDPALNGDLPIDFEADLDSTGGNSGSPVMNNRGELVGLLFDGNKEGLASDVVFDGTTTRSIMVDARYMLWTMDLLDDAKGLLSEMGIAPKM